MFQPSDITQPGPFLYHEPGVPPQPVDIARAGEQLVVRFQEMLPGDEDSVALRDVAGWFEPR